METKLQVFYNEESNVNIRMEKINDEPWFVAKDVAQALDISWSGATLASIPDDWKGMIKLNIPSSGTRGGGIQSLAIINEAALYKLAFRSNKPQADAFVNWVAGEVLPSIRRTGTYGVEQPERQRLPLPRLRPFFDEWKRRVRLYIRTAELIGVARDCDVTLSHVQKVYAGTSMSAPVTRRITAYAMENRKHNVRYPDPQPVHEQMCIQWDNE